MKGGQSAMTNATLSAQNPDHGASGSPWTTILWIIWIILIVGGAIGVVQRFTAGHLGAGYGSYVPWGLWIGLYFLGIGISGGSFIIGAVGLHPWDAWAQQARGTAHRHRAESRSVNPGICRCRARSRTYGTSFQSPHFTHIHQYDGFQCLDV